jgi:hypothetical protein
MAALFEDLLKEAKDRPRDSGTRAYEAKVWETAYKCHMESLKALLERKGSDWVGLQWARYSNTTQDANSASERKMIESGESAAETEDELADDTSTNGVSGQTGQVDSIE